MYPSIGFSLISPISYFSVLKNTAYKELFFRTRLDFSLQDTIYTVAFVESWKSKMLLINCLDWLESLTVL